MREIASWGSILAAAISAGCGLYAAFGIPIRDDIDFFINDLAWQSRWASAAAAAAGLSVLGQAFDKWLS
jgi:hypothetical protein